MSNKLCKTCKWWINVDENKQDGECELVGRNGSGTHGEWHPMRLAMTYGTGSSSDSGLWTTADFGCVQHELP